MKVSFDVIPLAIMLDVICISQQSFIQLRVVIAFCKYPSEQVNALVRLKFALGFEEMKVLINIFILSNYHPLSLYIKQKISKNERFGFYIMSTVVHMNSS